MTIDLLKDTLINLVETAKSLPDEAKIPVFDTNLYVARDSVGNFVHYAALYYTCTENKDLTSFELAHGTYMNKIVSMIEEVENDKKKRDYISTIADIDRELEDILAKSTRARSFSKVDGSRVLSKLIPKYDRLFNRKKMLQEIVNSFEVKRPKPVETIALEKEVLNRALEDLKDEKNSRTQSQEDVVEEAIDVRDEEANIEVLDTDEQIDILDDVPVLDATTKGDSEPEKEVVVEDKVVAGVRSETELEAILRKRQAKRQKIFFVANNEGQNHDVIYLGGEVTPEPQEEPAVAVGINVLEDKKQSAVVGINVSEELEPLPVSSDEARAEKARQYDELWRKLNAVSLVNEEILEENKQMISHLEQKIATLASGNNGSLEMAISLYRSVIDLLKNAKASNPLASIGGTAKINKSDIKVYNDLVDALVAESVRTSGSKAGKRLATQGKRLGKENSVRTAFDGFKNSIRDRFDGAYKTFVDKGEGTRVAKRKYGVKKNKNRHITRTVVALATASAIGISAIVAGVTSLVKKDKKSHNKIDYEVVADDYSKKMTTVVENSEIPETDHNFEQTNELTEDVISTQNNKNLCDITDDMNLNLVLPTQVSDVLADKAEQFIEEQRQEQLAQEAAERARIEAELEAAIAAEQARIRAEEEARLEREAEERAAKEAELAAQRARTAASADSDFSELLLTYTGTDEALMQVFGMDSSQWKTFCQTMLHEANPAAGYNEGVACVTTVINRFAHYGGSESMYSLVTGGAYRSYSDGYYSGMGDIYQDKYASCMAGIRDALYSYAVNQTRVHNYYEFKTGGTRDGVYFAKGGNVYHNFQKDSYYLSVTLDTSALGEGYTR